MLQSTRPFHLVSITFLIVAEIARQLKGGTGPVLVYGLEGMPHHEGEGMVCELFTSGQMRNQKGLFTLREAMAHNGMASITFRVSPPSITSE